MKFIDHAKIHVKAGNGGNGCIAFRREAHVPFGGPSGGDGGSGGSVVLRVDKQMSTLLDFQYNRRYKAVRGEDGRSKDQYGKGGEDLVLTVPMGTVIYDDESGEQLADLDGADDEIVIAQGGVGGQGNIHFATPWNQAPRSFTPGTTGEELSLRLELKLIADVGLLGYPSVGKSTLISKISRARPKIADYHFTTLVPNLGVVGLSDGRSMVVADIPGIIEGAADGAGLGHQFLRHVERTTVLLHLLEAHELVGPDREPLKDFDILNTELASYSPELAKKPQIVAVNKMDLTETQERSEELRAAFAERGIKLHFISAVAGTGVTGILELLWHQVHLPQSE